jgi:hypothetical protein
MIWYIFGIIALISLIVHWRIHGAVWGGLTIGIFIGLIISLFNLIKGNGFSWISICKGAIVGPIIGVLAELLGKVGDYFRNKELKKEQK